MSHLPLFCINLNQVALDMAYPISSQARCCRKDICVEKVLLFNGICCALLNKGFQILLDIQILNPVNPGFPAAIDDIPAGNLSKAVFGLGTLFGID